ncbi:uncharacterized protein znf638 isoform 1-T2 [Syngnathus typhle]
MSRPLYNPYAQRQPENEPRRVSSLVELGQSLSSSTGRLQPSESQPVSSLMANFRPQQRANTNEDIPGLDQDARRQEFRSSGTAATSAQNLSRSFDGSGGPLDRLSNYGRADGASSAYYQPSTSGGRSLYSASGKDDRNLRPVPRRDFGESGQSQASESAQPKYTSETAANILVHFGLEKDDLEHLISYPEDQITPANLPFILRQIRIQKTKKATEADRPKVFSGHAPARGGPASGDNWQGPGPARMERVNAPSSLLQSSKVIDYGHTSKYAGRSEEDVESRAQKAEGDHLLTMDNLDRRRSEQELVQQMTRSTNLAPSQRGEDYGHTSNYTGRLEGGAECSAKKGDGDNLRSMDNLDRRGGGQELVQQTTRNASLAPSLRDQKASLRSLFNSILKSNPPKSQDLVKPAATGVPSTFRPFTLATEDTDARDIKPQASKATAFGQVRDEPKPILKPQPAATFVRRAHPTRPDLVVLSGGNQPQMKKSVKPAEDPNKSTKAKTPATSSDVKKVQPQKQAPAQKTQQVKKQQVAKTQVKAKAKAKPQQPVKNRTLLPTPPLGQVVWQQGYPTSQQFQAISNVLNVPQMQLFNPGAGVVPPVTVFEGLPTAAMTLDYAATTPRVLPHTCSLCNVRCTVMQDWISHQNTNLHLENCKVLRKQYPNWQGEVLHVHKEEEKTKSAPVQSKTPRDGSRSSSRSSTPRGRRGSDAAREKRTRRRTRSRSPHSSRYNRRSRSYSTSSSDHHRSRSRSYERRHPHRSKEGHSSLSRRSHERRPSSRRRSSSRRPASSQKRSSSRRRSSSRSRHDRRPSPQRSRQRRSPPKRSHEESTAARKSQETSTSAERLAKKLLESSAVQSLSKESDVETMVKTLAPALLAEFAKMKSTPSTSSKGSAAATSTAAGSSSSSVAANKKPAATKTTPGQQRVDAARPKSVKASVPTIVTLRSIPRTLAYEDILAAAEKCGKIKSVVVFRTKGEAVVCFENKEDADKLRNTKIPKIKGWPVFVVQDQESDSKSDSKVEKNNPEKNAPAPSKASKPQTSKSTSAQDKAKTLPSKQITKVVKKVPVKPQAGAAGKKFDTTTPVAKTTQPPGKTTKVPQQATGKSKPPSKAVSHSQPPPEPMEVDPGVASEEPNQQTIGAQAEPAGGPALAQGDSPDAERATAQAKTITDAAPVEEPVSQPGLVKSEADGGSSLKGEEAVKEEAAPPRDSDTAAKKEPPSSGEKDHVAHPCGSDPTVKNEPQPGSNPTLKEDPAASGESDQLAQENLETSCVSGTAAKNGSAASSDAAAKTGVALPHDSAARVKEEAPSHSSDASAKKGAAKSTAPPCGSKASSKKNAAPPAVFKTTRPYTVGEKMKEHLVPENLHIRTTCWKQEGSQMLITNLPADEHTYCEQDVVDVFNPFGMANSDDNIYVIPQLEIAFIQLQDYACVLSAIRASENGKLALKGHTEKLNAQVVDISMWPGGFYQSVMMLLNYKVTKHGPKTVYIKNIEPSEVSILREVLRRICGIVNFMPLMNKVFVEFASVHHVDRFGVWYSLHAQCPTYQIYRLGLPNVDKYSPKPRSPELGMPDRNATFAEAALIDFLPDFPCRTASPFYLTLRRKPYLFSTISPWFIIPAFLTVKRKADIIDAEFGGAAMVKTVMLTGLPQGCYTHEEVAKLAWPFLAKKDLRALYYNVIVLPAQRRAFVQFNDWNSCCNFVLSQLPSPLRVGRYILGVHLLMKSLYKERSQEADMYVALMRLSNSYVGEDLKTLSERLLCVEISEARKQTYYKVLDEVSSRAKIVNFLPLANRICIEMEDAAGVACVVEKCKDLKMNELAWKPVQSFCSAKRLEECLQDPRQITLNHKIYAVSASLSATPWTAPPTLSAAQTAPSAAQTNTPSDAPSSSSAAQTATSSDAPLSSLAAQTETSSDAPPTSSDFPTAPSAVVVSNPGKPVESLASAPCAEETAAKNDSVKVERSMAEKTAAVLEVQDNKEDAMLPASTGGANDVPDVKNTSAAVDQDQEESLVKSDNALGDSEKDVPFDEPPFNIDEFVTVDEVGDQEDSAGEAPSALKRSSSQAELLPASKRTKASTSKESKVSASTPSPSSRATRSSTRMGLSSGFTPSPASMSAKKRQRKQPKASQHQSIILSTTDSKDESLETMASEESYQVLDSVGEDQKPLSVEVGNPELAGNGATELRASPEQDNIGQVDGVEEEQAPPVHTSQVEEQENRGGENEVTDVKEDGVGEEQTAQSLQTNKDAAEEPTSAELDRQVAETSTGLLSKDDTVASGQEEGEEEAEAYQVIDSVEEPPNSAEDEHSVPEACESRAASSRTLKSKARTSLKNQESTATPKTSDFSKYLVVDSVQIEQTVGRRRSTRGKAQGQSAKIPAEDGPTFHVIDSVDDESSTTPRGTRGKRGRPPKRDAASSEDRAQEEKPATRRAYPLRTSQEGPQGKTKNEAILKEEPSCQVLDQVKIPPAPRGRGRKGRPKKVVKTEEEDDDDDDEEATTFQVVDSVDDETGQEMASSEKAPDSPKQEDVTDGTSLVKLEDEEEPTYQVVDSLEEDPAEEEESVSDVCAPMTTEGGQTELRDETTEGENNQEADVKGEDAPSQVKTRSQQRSAQSPPLATKDDTPSTLALDQVSDEEEDFPDNGTKKPAERAEEEEKKSDWGLEPDGSSKWRARRGEDEDELLTLDQVVAEEGGEQLAPESDVSEGELALVTLDELVEEQEEAKGPPPSSEGEQSEGCLNPETLLTLDETWGEEDEDEKSEAAETSQSTKRKRSDDAEEDNTNLVTLDQVGDVEEDVLRSTMEKRHRSASATISTGADQDEMEAAASGEAPRAPSDHHEEEKEEREKVAEKENEQAENKEKEEEKPRGEGEEVEENTEKEKENAEANEEDAPSAGQSLQGSLQKLSKGKRAAELTTTAAKRSRSESPCSTPAYVLPAFKPNNPLGMEFVLPKSGYFCKLCSVFYMKESTAKDVHCSSKRHYDNLKKYYREREQNSRSSTQGSISD